MTTVVTQLDPKDFPWMRARGVVAIFDALEKYAGSSDTVRFVGGCVRNALMECLVGDIDLATQLEPKAVMAALEAAKIRSIPTGLAHGTVTAVIDKTPYEITSLRRDIKTDGRHAVVEYTTDWGQDAQRRDLTMNALYADFGGQIYDPTGQGLDDLAAKRFAFVGDADARVQEDYLRILRFFRFLAWYGEGGYGEGGKPEASALTACRENRSGLKQLSAERVWIEIKKILRAPDPSRVMRIMLTQGILETILPEASNVEGLELIVPLMAKRSNQADPLLRLMAMASRDPLSTALLCKRMKMSKAESARLMAWAMDATPLDPNMDERAKKIALYTGGKQAVSDRALLRAAGAMEGSEEDPIISARWAEFADIATVWEMPEFPLKGKDLIKAGVEPGEAMGKKLAALKALWVRSGFTVDREKLLMALKLLG